MAIDANAASARTALPVLLVLLFALWEGAMAGSLGFGPNFDEWEHFSIVQDLKRHPSLLPDQYGPRLLAPDGTWTDEINRLPHPPGYHFLAALMPAQADVPSSWKLARIASLLLVVLALAAFARHVGQRLEGVFAPLLAVLMQVLYMPLGLAGALVTNDSLAYACGVGVCIAIDRWRQSSRQSRWLVLLALCLAVAGWTKLTAASLLFCLAAVSVLAGCGNKPGSQRKAAAVIGLAAIPGGIPYLDHFIAYGHPLFPGHLFIGHNFEMEPVAFGTWVWEFLKEVVSNGMAFSGRPADPVRLAASALMFAALPAAPLAVLAFGRADLRPIALAGLTAFAATLAIHLAHTYQVHQLLGQTPHIAGAHARLYLPLLPTAALLAGSLAEGPSSWRRRLLAACLALLILGSPQAFLL